MFQTLTVSSAEQVKNEPGGSAAWRLSDTLGYTCGEKSDFNKSKLVTVVQDKNKKVRGLL